MARRGASSTLGALGMTKDENLSLYLYVLAAAAVIVASIWFFSPQKIEVPRIALDAVDVGAIETASVRPRRKPVLGQEWNGEVIPWRSFEDGVRRMSESGKRGVLVMQADWCLVCRSYQKLFSDQSITKHSEDYVFMIVDIENAPDIQQRYNVDGDYIPRTFLLEPDGSLALDATGGHPRQKFFVDPFRPKELSRLLSEGVANR